MSKIVQQIMSKVKQLIINMIGYMNGIGSTLAHVTLVSPTCVTGVTCVCLQCHLRVTLVSQSRVTDVTFACILACQKRPARPIKTKPGTAPRVEWVATNARKN